MLKSSGRLYGGAALVAAVVLFVSGVAAAPAYAAAAPVISSFTPTVVAAGDTVTVQASGVDATTTAAVNGVAATVTARTTTSLTMTAPPGASGGKITLTGATGSATSTDDLFVVPAGTAVSDVGGTGRIPVAAKTTVSVPAGKTLIRLFDDTGTDRYAVLAEASGCLWDVRAYDARLGLTGASSCSGASSWVDTMPVTGVAATRMLTVRNTSAATASIDVTIYKVPADANLGTLTTDGTAKTVTLGNPGQNGYLTFAGTAGQKVVVQTSGASAVFLCCSLLWAVYNPDGTQLSSSRVGNDTTEATLPTTGTYQVRLNPVDVQTGSVTISAWSAPTDVNLGTLPLDGTATTATISNAGQNGYLSFTGTAGQRIAVQTTNASAVFLCCYLTWGLYAPDGTQLGTTRTGNDYLDATTLPATGTYQLRLDPGDIRTGSVTVSAWTVPADAALGTLPLTGAATTATISNPGQNGYLTFSGTAGQRVAVQVTNAAAAFLCCYLTWGLYAPDGTQLGTTKTGNDYLEAATLPTTGTYRLRLDPADVRTGTATVTAWTVPADANLGTLLLDGTLATATIGNPGQNGYLTFAGTAGKTVTVTAANASAAFLCCYVTWSIKRPDGSTLATRIGTTSLTTTLDATGTYQLYVDPADSRTGSVTLTAVTGP